MANFRKASNAKSMFISLKTFLTNQDRLYISAPEMAWNMQMSTNDNSINAEQLAPLATNSHLFTSRFPYFLENLCLYFEKYGRTSVLLADFRTNIVKYKQVGRSEDAGFSSTVNVSLCKEAGVTHIHRPKHISNEHHTWARSCHDASLCNDTPLSMPAPSLVCGDNSRILTLVSSSTAALFFLLPEPLTSTPCCCCACNTCCCCCCCCCCWRICSCWACTTASKSAGACCSWNCTWQIWQADLNMSFLATGQQHTSYQSNLCL